MNRKKNIQLLLTDVERANLRKNKIKKADILAYAVDELQEILQVSNIRARKIYALADFQQIPSIGIKFAEDLIFMGFYKVQDLAKEDGATLVNEYEKKKGYWIDSCVEDQFRLVVYVAKTNDYSKNWWDFTEERKHYRKKIGYPENRPLKAWYQH
ncbi:helix-hairpin-helix domain-containing protein [Spongiivirga sp. MCCC 1A20706]|uniref:helix-hairpin-helix domain-containing protein n=1 Tax=Spongiivirga sp. MCCC 1A20706 TaxID=3160963 RepID=UPI003977BE6A